MFTKFGGVLWMGIAPLPPPFSHLFPFSLGLVSDNYLLRVARMSWISRSSRITLVTHPICPISLVLLICSSQSSWDSGWRDRSAQSASRLHPGLSSLS